MNEYKVEVTRKQPGSPNGQLIQTFNCAGLDKVWSTVDQHRNKAGTLRIRVYNLLEVFEVR